MPRTTGEAGLQRAGAGGRAGGSLACLNSARALPHRPMTAAAGDCARQALPTPCSILNFFFYFFLILGTALWAIGIKASLGGPSACLLGRSATGTPPPCLLS